MPKNQIRKKAFTLIELIVSLFLVSLILMAIFRFFSSSIKMEIFIEEAKKEIFFKNNLQVKLETIFSKIHHSAFTDKPLFYTEDNKLFFIYDNEIDPNPNLSSKVFATLYLSKKNNLTLKIYPFEKKKSICRKEILAKNIENLSFTFFYKQNDKTDKIHYWPKKKLSLPAAIKIELDKNSFAFFLKSVQSLIIYKEKKI